MKYFNELLNINIMVSYIIPIDNKINYKLFSTVVA